MGKKSKENSKAKLVWGITFSIIFTVCLISLLVLVYLYYFAGYSIKENGTESSESFFALSIPILLFSSIATCLISYFLLADYEKPNGKKGALCMTFYVISSIPIFIILAVIYIGKKIINFNSDSSPKPKELKFEDANEDDYGDFVFTIRDEVGHELVLHWDKYTKTWRDVNGWHYVTDDKGKSFRFVRK